MSLELRTAVGNLWQELGSDPAVRAVVLTGAGRAFSAGGNIPEFMDTVNSVELRRSNIREAGRLVQEMLRFHLPVIAAVNGPAVGLGASIAVMADLVYMAESAFLADPHVGMGLVAADGGVVTWPLMMSILRAKEYLFTGDRISSADAVSLGLANRVVPDSDLLDVSVRLAHRLAGQPAQALQDTKRAINMHLTAAAQHVLPYALALEELSFTSDDVRHAIERFSSKAEGRRDS